MTQKPFAASDPAISMNYLSFVFRTLGKDGYEVETLLAGTGLTAKQLEDPDFRCDFWSSCRFYKNAIALTNDPHLGPKLAQRFETNYIGLPAYAAMNAACLGEALVVLNRFLFLTFPAVEFTFPDGEVKPQTGEVGRVSAFMFIGLVVILLIFALPLVLKLGILTFVSVILLVGFAIAIGHFLGGPEPETRLTLGLANSTRNAGLALTLATLNFKDQILPVADSGDGDPGILAVIAAIALLAFVMDAIYANIYLASERRLPS